MKKFQNGGESMLKVNRLSKSFGKVHAVKDVSFHVKKGSTFAFLGTNGAGKSTVIHMIINLLKPDHGDITFTGGAFEEVTGIVFQTHRLDEELTIEENLMTRAKLYGLSKKEALKRIDELLGVTQLSDKRKRQYGQCSGGEKRKTDIIRALLHHPKFLILDEPTTGLDAESREEVWAFLRSIQIERGLTIFLTTHYIDEAEDADDVLIMHDGRVEVEGTPHELKSNFSKTTLELHADNKNHIIDWLNCRQYSFVSTNNMISITLQNSKEAIPILNMAEENITHFSIEEASLEQVFLQVTEQIKRKVRV